MDGYGYVINSDELANAINLVMDHAPDESVRIGDRVDETKAFLFCGTASKFLGKCREIPDNLTYHEFNKLQGSSEAYVRGWQISLDEARVRRDAARIVQAFFTARAVSQ